MLHIWLIFLPLSVELISSFFSFCRKPFLYKRRQADSPIFCNQTIVLSCFLVFSFCICWSSWRKHWSRGVTVLNYFPFVSKRRQKLKKMYRWISHGIVSLFTSSGHGIISGGHSAARQIWMFYICLIEHKKVRGANLENPFKLDKWLKVKIILMKFHLVFWKEALLFRSSKWLTLENT